MALAAPKVLCKAKRQSRAQCSMFKVQSYEKGYLEIHHSDSSSHLDRHRHQPGSHQLHLLRKGAHQGRGTEKEDGHNRSSSFFVYSQLQIVFSNTPTIYQEHPLNFNLSFGLRFNLK